MDSKSIKIFRCKNKNGKISDLALGKMDIPYGLIEDGIITDKKLLQEILVQAYNKYKLQKTKVYTVINSRKVVTRLIEIPKKANKKLPAVVNWEAQRFLSHSIEENVIDFVNLGKAPKDHEMLIVLVAAVPKEIVCDYINVFQSAKLKINAVDIISMALKRWLFLLGREGWPDAKLTNIAVINLGDSIANLNIFQKGQLVFLRRLDFKCDRLININYDNDKIIKNIFIDLNFKDILQDLLIEVSDSLKYGQSKLELEPVAKFIITGSMSSIPGIEEAFKEEFNLPVEMGEVNFSNKDIKISSEMAASAGLSLREV